MDTVYPDYSIRSRWSLKHVSPHPPFDDSSLTRSRCAGSVGYTISKSTLDEASVNTARQGMESAIKKVKGISTLSVPEGKTVEEMSVSHPQSKWRNPDRRIQALREEAKQSAVEYSKLRKGFKSGVTAMAKPR